MLYLKKHLGWTIAVLAVLVFTTTSVHAASQSTTRIGSRVLDIDAPEEASNFQAEVVGEDLVLSWDKSGSPDLADQTLYWTIGSDGTQSLNIIPQFKSRRLVLAALDGGAGTSPGSGGVSLGPDPNTVTVSNLDSSLAYTFRLTSTDASGNESAGVSLYFDGWQGFGIIDLLNMYYGEDDWPIQMQGRKSLNPLPASSVASLSDEDSNQMIVDDSEVVNEEDLDMGVPGFEEILRTYTFVESIRNYTSQGDRSTNDDKVAGIASDSPVVYGNNEQGDKEIYRYLDPEVFVTPKVVDSVDQVNIQTDNVVTEDSDERSDSVSVIEEILDPEPTKEAIVDGNISTDASSDSEEKEADKVSPIDSDIDSTLEDDSSDQLAVAGADPTTESSDGQVDATKNTTQSYTDSNIVPMIKLVIPTVVIVLLIIAGALLVDFRKRRGV